MTRQTGDSAIWRARRESPHRRDGMLRIDRCRDMAPGHATPRRVPAPGCSFGGGALRVEPVVGVGLGDVDDGV